MEELLKKIFNENGYEPRAQPVPFFSNQDRTFFFWLNISEATFRTFTNKQKLNDNPDYTTLLDGFKSIVNSGEQVTIEKNSSLIVLVCCANIASLADLQQQILLLEEDEYFFKKYVVLYTEDSISQLSATPILPVLKEKISSLENFNAFAANGYADNLAEYLVIMQLYIKLPFLKLEQNDDDFESLDQKITEALDELSPFHAQLLNQSNNFIDVDFENSADEEKINNLINLL